MKKNGASITLALLLTAILMAFNNCGAEKALQSTLDNYFAVLTTPTAQGVTGDPSIVEGTYFSANYKNNGDFEYLELDFASDGGFSSRKVTFPGGNLAQGFEDKKTGTYTVSQNHYSLTYSQETCHSVGTDVLELMFSDATDILQVSYQRTGGLKNYFSQKRYELPQSVVSQIGTISTSTCQ